MLVNLSNQIVILGLGPYQNVSECTKPYLIDFDWVRLRMVGILYGYDKVQESEELLYDFQKIT
jgi:hypothetical protein